MKKQKKLLFLFLTFLKIGAFTFGGGYAMIPLIQKEVVEKNKWVSDQDILEIIAISESTPGPIAINTATFIGYRYCGFLGAVLSTAGVVLPSFIIILIISFVLRKFQNLTVIKYAFNGIRVGVLALIIKALVLMYKECPKYCFSYLVIGTSFIIAAFTNIKVLFIIIGCGFAGLVYTFFLRKQAHK